MHATTQDSDTPSCTVTMFHISTASNVSHFPRSLRTGLLVPIWRVRKPGSERYSDLLKVTEQELVNLSPTSTWGPLHSPTNAWEQGPLFLTPL
jgi:hypothetical protein